MPFHILLNIPLHSPNSMDSEARSRFLPFRLERHLVDGLAEPWWREHSLECGSDRWNQFKEEEMKTNKFEAAVKRRRQVQECVSPDLIGLHYVRPEEMYSLHFLLKKSQDPQQQSKISR